MKMKNYASRIYYETLSLRVSMLHSYVKMETQQEKLKHDILYNDCTGQRRKKYKGNDS